MQPPSSTGPVCSPQVRALVPASVECETAAIHGIVKLVEILVVAANSGELTVDDEILDLKP